MAYNHRQAEAEWKHEEDKIETVMRQSGMSEENIQTIIGYDRMVFNSERKYLSYLEEITEDIAYLIDCEECREIGTVEQLLDEVSNPILHQVLLKADTFTLNLLLMKVQGFSTRDICLRFDIDEGVFTEGCAD